MTDLSYAAIIRPLTEEEGGGYLAEFPDIPGCYADGKTPLAALQDAESALYSWIETAKEFGDPIPKIKNQYSGQWRLRIPKHLHAELAYRAKYEGVSLNTLVTTVLAEYAGTFHDKHKKRSTA
jgi:antitoxin HicB